MSKLLLKANAVDELGVMARVRTHEVDWKYLNMAVRRLPAGARYAGQTNPGQEHLNVILGGRCHIRSSAGDFLELGRRANVFEGMPWALYLPGGIEFEIEALTPLEIAAAWADTPSRHPARLIKPEDCAIEIRGGGNATRQITSILPPGSPCGRLVCVEVYTPSGNWSSYPPHKHDEHRVGPDGALTEADLEEIYFYQFERPEGFAYQRVYTSDGRLDELVMARHNDTVLVPEGYHPVVGGHGCHTYYLNFLAGSAQSLANRDDPEYAWVKASWGAPDARLPLVHLGMEG